MERELKECSADAADLLRPGRKDTEQSASPPRSLARRLPRVLRLVSGESASEDFPGSYIGSSDSPISVRVIHQCSCLFALTLPPERRVHQPRRSAGRKRRHHPPPRRPRALQHRHKGRRRAGDGGRHRARGAALRLQPPLQRPPPPGVLREKPLRVGLPMVRVMQNLDCIRTFNLFSSKCGQPCGHVMLSHWHVPIVLPCVGMYVIQYRAVGQSSEVALTPSRTCNTPRA